MEKENEIFKELEEIAPGLGSIKKPGEFPVPANYFEGLSDILQEKVAKKKRFAFIPWTGILQNVYFRYAMVLIIVALTGLLYRYFDSDLTKTKATQDIVTTEDYILENMDEAELIEYMEDTYASNAANNNTAEKANAVTEKEIENIMLDEIDENLLIEEL